MEPSPTLPKVRSDLIVTRDPETPDYYFVKDPIRGQFQRLNELQISMMHCLDGVNTLDDTIELLGEEFGFEVPRDAIERFLKRLEKDFLLDISAYTSSEATRKTVRRLLQKSGLIWRSPGRAASQESVLFQEGIRQIEEGDPCRSVKCFRDVLRLNPNNTRAREILDILHHAFFNAHRGIPSHVRMFRLVDPDVFLARLDRWLGPVIFNVWAFVGLLILSAFAASTLLDLRVPPFSEISVFDIVAGLVLAVCCTAVHECGHGLACKHYGGRVHDMGLILLFGVFGGAYCDTSDTYTFSERRHKIYVALFGTYASMAVISAFLIAHAFSSEAFVLHYALLIAAAIEIPGLWGNLIPFAKFDGYYALADYLNVSNLRERAFGYWKALLGNKLLGVGEPPEVDGRHERIFVTYGALGVLYTVLLVFWVWIGFLVPLIVSYFGLVGLIALVVYAIRIFRHNVIAPLWRFTKFLWAYRSEVFSLRRSLTFVGCGVVILGCFSIPWPHLIHGTMRIESARRVIVKAAVDGQVSEILVGEGDRVDAGAIVARMKSDTLARSIAETRSGVVLASLRLDALIYGPRMEELRLAQASTRLASVQRRHALDVQAKKKAMAGARVISSSEATAATFSANSATAEAAATGADLRLLRAGATEADLKEAEAMVEKLEAKLRHLETLESRLVLRSTTAGIVVGRNIRQRVGEHLEAGAPLLEVHDPASVRATIELDSTEPTDGLAPGRRVALKAARDPERRIDARVLRLLPRASPRAALLVQTASVANPGWPIGATGRARIYGESIPIGYQILGVPVIRMVAYEGWRLFGGGV